MAQQLQMTGIVFEVKWGYSGGFIYHQSTIHLSVFFTKIYFLKKTKNKNLKKKWKKLTREAKKGRRGGKNREM